MAHVQEIGWKVGLILSLQPTTGGVVEMHVTVVQRCDVQCLLVRYILIHPATLLQIKTYHNRTFLNGKECMFSYC